MATKARIDFCFTFYDTDAARDMSHMNRLERGAYTDLVMAQRKFGVMKIEQIRKILGRDFDEVWPSIEVILGSEDVQVEGEGVRRVYFITWLRNSIEDSKAHSVKQRTNALGGAKSAAGETKRQPPPSLAKPNSFLGDPLEDEDRKEEDRKEEAVVETFGKSENLLREAEPEPDASELLDEWTRLILEDRDDKFQLLVTQERREKKIFVVNPDWVRNHLAKCYRENWEPTSQHRFRLSLMSYLRTCNQSDYNKKTPETAPVYTPPPRKEARQIDKPPPPVSEDFVRSLIEADVARVRQKKALTTAEALLQEKVDLLRRSGALANYDEVYPRKLAEARNLRRSTLASANTIDARATIAHLDAGKEPEQETKLAEQLARKLMYFDYLNAQTKNENVATSN